jgi:hypothetical protein
MKTPRRKIDKFLAIKIIDDEMLPSLFISSHFTSLPVLIYYGDWWEEN